MKDILEELRRPGASAGVALSISIAALCAARTAHAQEPPAFYVGDAISGTIKQFVLDPATNAWTFQGDFTKKGSNQGPMGLIFGSDGNLLTAFQNPGNPPHSGKQKPGVILRWDGETGALLGAVVDQQSSNRLAAPHGVLLSEGPLDGSSGRVLFVSDVASSGQNSPPGRLLAYTEQGAFVADLTPNPFTQFPGGSVPPGGIPPEEFHPRGLVINPTDHLLYVAVVDDLDTTSPNYPITSLRGWILRFDPQQNGRFAGVFASEEGAHDCNRDLHRPDGLAFGPDGNLYVTAFRADPNDTDKILKLDPSGHCIDEIPLDDTSDRAYAQDLLFGPDDRLFVPITGTGSATGSVRSYDVTSHDFDVIVPPAAQSGPLGSPWYLTFRNTNPSTLAYEP